MLSVHLGPFAEVVHSYIQTLVTFIKIWYILAIFIIFIVDTGLEKVHWPALNFFSKFRVMSAILSETSQECLLFLFFRKREGGGDQCGKGKDTTSYS